MDPNEQNPTPASAPDPIDLDDAALEAQLRGDDAGPEDVAAPAEHQEDQADQNWNPDGPGDLKVALQQERQRRQALDVELTTYRQREAEQQARAEAERAAAQRAQYEDDLAVQVAMMEPDEVPAFLARERERVEAETHQRLTGSAAEERITMSAEILKDLHPDYEATIQNLYQHLGVDVVDALAAKQSNPAKWAYEYGKTNFPSDAQRKSAIDAEVQRQVQAVLSKQNPPSVTGHRSIGHAASNGSTSPIEKDPSEMTDSELEAALYGR